MATQERNQELVDLLEPDFLRNKLPFIVKGNFSYHAEMEFGAVGVSGVTVIPDGSDDVKKMIWYTALVATSNGNSSAAVGSLEIGGADVLHNNGTDMLAIFVNGDGSVVMQPLVGAATYDVSLSLRWI